MVDMKIQFMVLHMTVGLSFQSCPDILDHPQLNKVIRYDGCVPETYQGGQWVPDKDRILCKCLQCQGWGDPHFEEFSKAKFAWYDGCNYALVQNGFSENPDFGVFMDFKQKDKVAHVGPTIYQDDINTKVELYPTPLEATSKLFHVKVNGVKQVITLSTPTLLRGPNNIETSVFAWKNSTCVRLYGKSKILVELCESKITIWAPPKDILFQVTLGGLCGSTDSTAIQEQKLVARNGTEYPNPGNWITVPDLNFGNSWKTKEQTKDKCKGKKKRSQRKLRSVEIEHEHLHMNCVNHINSNHSTVHPHHKMCLGVHKGEGSTGDDHLEACKYDLCIVAKGTEHRLVGFTVNKMLENHMEIHARTKIHRANTGIKFLPYEKITGLPQLVIRPVQNPPLQIQQITPRPTRRMQLHQTVTATVIRPVPIPPQHIVTTTRLASFEFVPVENCFGSCVPIDKCPSLSNILIKAQRGDPVAIQKLRSSVCSNTNGLLYVCCQPESVSDGFPEHCGGVNKTERVVGGDNAAIKQWPWMALLRASVGDFTRWVCGGVLINARYVLTAAHCTGQYKVDLVRLGELVLNQDPDISAGYTAPQPQDIRIEKFILHPKYKSPCSKCNDIALIKLANPARVDHEFVEPICISRSPSRNIENSASGWVADWGLSTENPYIFSQTRHLQQLQVPIQELKFCRDRKQGQGYPDSAMIFCAGGKDTCRGDSGGPLMVLSQDNSWYTIGIVSFGNTICGAEGSQTLFTNIRYYLPWIEDNIFQ